MDYHQNLWSTASSLTIQWTGTIGPTQHDSIKKNTSNCTTDSKEDIGIRDICRCNGGMCSIETQMPWTSEELKPGPPLRELQETRRNNDQKDGATDAINKDISCETAHNEAKGPPPLLLLPSPSIPPLPSPTNNKHRPIWPPSTTNLKKCATHLQMNCSQANRIFSMLEPDSLGQSTSN